MSNLKAFDTWPDKQKLFAHEYLVDQNMKYAAIRAGYSERSARDTGHKLYHKPHINAWITDKLESKCEKLGVTAEGIIQELREIGFIRRDEVLAAGRSPDDDLPPPVTLNSTMKMSDKIKSLELLGRNLKMWTDKVETTGDRTTVIIRDLTGKKAKGE